MSLIQSFPFFTVMITLFGGVISLAFGPKAARRLCVFLIFVSCVMSFVLLEYCLNTGKSFPYMMGHFPAPFGNEIRAGAFEALFAFGFSVVMLLSLMGGMDGILSDVPKKKQNLFFLMMNLLFCSLLALIYTNDIFTAYVFVEINTIAACAIVMGKETGETVVATIHYLIMSLIGSGLFLIAISMLYDLTGHLLFPNMYEGIQAIMTAGEYMLPMIIIIGLMAVGLGVKSALYPFHSWLPDAHGSATTAASSILSGLVLKGYIVLLIKLLYRVFGPETLSRINVFNVLFVLGLLGMIIGSILALKENNIKRMIAYSSVAQIGYIFMGIGMGSMVGMVAALFHVFSHAVTKPLLFTTAGGLIKVSGGHKDYASLRGAAWRDPLAGFGFAVGALSMIGLPLFSGFISKFYFAVASFQNPSETVAVLLVLALSMILNAMYYIPAVASIYSRAPGDLYEKPAWYSRLYVASVSAFVILNFMLGIFPERIIHIIEAGLKVL